jgi:predicted small metal-binding protein
MSETLRCESGFQARADDEDGLVTEVRRHAWQAHRMPPSPADALQLIRRSSKEDCQT